MRSKVIILFFGLLGLNAFAQEQNPYSVCEQAMEDTAFLRCKIAVVDQQIVDEFGEEGLEAANLMADEECKVSSHLSKLDPRLRLLALLNCRFEAKLGYYKGSLQ